MTVGRGNLAVGYGGFGSARDVTHDPNLWVCNECGTEERSRPGRQPEGWYRIAVQVPGSLKVLSICCSSTCIANAALRLPGVAFEETADG